MNATLTHTTHVNTVGSGLTKQQNQPHHLVKAVKLLLGGGAWEHNDKPKAMTWRPDS